jgi:hypothetical protein
MEQAPEPSAGAPGAGAVAVTALVGAALLAAAFAGDGSGVDGILPVGGAAVVLLAGTLVASWLGSGVAPRLGRSGGMLAVTMVALVAWTGATVAWSIVPDRSWDTFNKSVAFAAFLGLGILVAAWGGRALARLGASMLALVTGFVLAWALLAKVVPALDPGGDRVARLREPVEHWNALALVADMALALGLWLGASRGHRTIVRAGGGVLVYVATLALLLAISRAGVVAGIVIIALWLGLSRERVAGGLLLVASALPAGLVGAWAFTRPALVDDGASRSDRVADGAIFGVLAFVGASVVIVLVVLGSRLALGRETRRRIDRGLLAAAALGAAGVAAAFALAVGSAVSSGPSCREVVNDPSRFGSYDLGDRWCWWNEAWDVFAGHTPEGAGAGTFEIARRRYRVDARNVVQPHSVPLQELADGGVVALGLFLAFVAAAAATCRCALRRLDGGERAAAVALVAAPVAYGLHALVDYDWDFLAVTAPAMVALGVLAAAGRPFGNRSRRPLLAVAAVLVALAVLVSFSFPRLAERNARASTRALDDDDYARAQDQALWARFFNPLAVEPVFALARIAEKRNFRNTAEGRYVQAVELQPENPETWYALGLFEFQELGNTCAVYRFLNNAYTLDPAGNQWVKGGPLDVARDAVNAGACEENRS